MREDAGRTLNEGKGRVEFSVRFAVYIAHTMSVLATGGMIVAFLTAIMVVLSAVVATAAGFAFAGPVALPAPLNE